VQGVAGHLGLQGGGSKKNNQKKWRAEEVERHKGSLTQKNMYAPGPVEHVSETSTINKSADLQSNRIIYFIETITGEDYIQNLPSAGLYGRILRSGPQNEISLNIT
jgi:hypothetical protein